MTKYTQQKSIAIYNDVSGTKFTVAESVDPGSIDLVWDFHDEVYRIECIPVDLASEVAKALTEICSHIRLREIKETGGGLLFPNGAIGGTKVVGS
jgi:hypothetical protein